MDSEAELRAALEGHFYSLTFEPVAKVIDLASEERAKALCPWSKENLLELLLLKRRGFTVEAISGETGRDRRSIGDAWARRDEWMAEIADLIPPKPCIEQVVPVVQGGFVTLEDIRRVVCQTYRVGKADFVSDSRIKSAVEARHAFFWIARRFTTKSQSKIAGYAGGRDHATVRHGYVKVELRFQDYEAKIVACLKALGLELEQRREAA